MIEMFVQGIGIEETSGAPVVILNDAAERRMLPIWIGPAEAGAIQVALTEKRVERPTTHDLLLKTIFAVGYKVKEVAINEISGDAYLATVTLIPAGKDCAEAEKHLDARPSDAIALALRAKAPILVSAAVIAQGTVPTDRERDETEAAQFKEFLDSVKPSDFKLPPGLKVEPPAEESDAGGTDKSLSGDLPDDEGEASQSED